MKTWILPVLALAVCIAMPLTAEAPKTWKGEVIDVACYVTSGDEARGPKHADCAKRCLKSGQPMALLTDDGTLVMLVADSRDNSAYEALKDMAGEIASVAGTLAERDGMKVVTVTGAKKAS